MLDTLRLKSPAISAEAADALAHVGLHRIAFDASTGDEVYHITTAELEGSHDHRVMFRLEGEGGGASIVLEGSVHKLLLGHNIFGGSDDLQACARFLVAGVSRLLNVELPPSDLWRVHKADVAGAYLFDSFEAVEGYFRALQGVSYPRRKVSRHGFQSIHVPGRMTTLKLYHKGVEFSVHDRKRLKKLLVEADVNSLQDYANRVLRSEVSLRRRLVEDFGEWPLVSQVTPEYLRRVHDAEMARLVREGQAEMRTVRTYMQVKARLYEHYTDRTARVLLGTWMQLSAMGEEETKKGMKRRTFYLHRKQLLEVGCSWHSSDIHQGAQIFPADFVPVLSDARALREEAPEVVKQLDPFRAA